MPFYPIPLHDKEGKPNYNMIAAYAALTHKTVNVADAYAEEGFDFSGTRNFDKRTGYRSKSFLTVPMKDHEGDIIGVLQLLNAIGIALSQERDTNKLLETILIAAKNLTHADGGTLYRLMDDKLQFEIVRTDSLSIAMGGTSGK